MQSNNTTLMIVTEQQLALYATELAKTFHHGVIHLLGSLGAGKTAFCRHFIKTVIPQSSVTSPTYSIVHEYQTTKKTIYHIDLYRIKHPLEVEELGLRNLDKNSIVLIEWPENGKSATPRADVIIRLEHQLEDTRSISIDHQSYNQNNNN